MINFRLVRENFYLHREERIFQLISISTEEGEIVKTFCLPPCLSRSPIAAVEAKSFPSESESIPARLSRVSDFRAKLVKLQN